MKTTPLPVSRVAHNLLQGLRCAERFVFDTTLFILLNHTLKTRCGFGAFNRIVQPDLPNGDFVPH